MLDWLLHFVIGIVIGIVIVIGILFWLISYEGKGMNNNKKLEILPS